MYAPQIRRIAGEQAALDDEVTDAEREEGLRGMERALRDSLSVRRANEFVKRLPGEKGTRISSADLPFTSEADLTELIALMLHAESNEAAYKLESTRSRAEVSEIALDSLPGARVEHFDLIKK